MLESDGERLVPEGSVYIRPSGATAKYIYEWGMYLRVEHSKSKCIYEWDVATGSLYTSGAGLVGVAADGERLLHPTPYTLPPYIYVNLQQQRVYIRVGYVSTLLESQQMANDSCPRDMLRIYRST